MLEGAGRTIFEFESDGAHGVPFEFKLGYARQCRDEARHCEISARLLEWTGSEIGSYQEIAMYEAAAVRDPHRASRG